MWKPLVMQDKCSLELTLDRLDQSTLQEYKENATDDHIVYGIWPYLMTPFRNAAPGLEINYNTLLKKKD